MKKDSVLPTRQAQGSDRARSAAAEGIALVVILVGTLLWRIVTLGQTALGEYYELAKVSSTGAFEPDVANGAENLYLRLLHGVLWVLGNTETAAYALQLVLFMLLVLAFYFGVRGLYGSAAALIASALLGASPLAGERLQVDSPSLLFCLVYFLGFGLAVSWWSRWNRYQVQRGLAAALGRCLLIGLTLGLGIYMDATAALTIVLFACVLIGGRKPAGAGATDFVYGFWNLRPLDFLMVLLFGAATCGGMLYVTGLAPETWLAQYTDIEFAQPWLDASFLTPWMWEIVIVAVMLVLGVLAILLRRGVSGDRRSARIGMVLCTLLLIALQYCGIAQDTPVDSYALLYLFLLILAGMGMSDLFTPGKHPRKQPAPEPVKVPEPAVQEPAPEPVREPEPEPMPEPVAEQKIAEPEPEPAQVTFLESPLPLPKKPAHKTLDYDVEVADDDDYDIQ